MSRWTVLDPMAGHSIAAATAAAVERAVAAACETPTDAAMLHDLRHTFGTGAAA